MTDKYAEMTERAHIAENKLALAEHTIALHEIEINRLERAVERKKNLIERQARELEGLGDKKLVRALEGMDAFMHGGTPKTKQNKRHGKNKQTKSECKECGAISDHEELIWQTDRHGADYCICPVCESEDLAEL